MHHTRPLEALSAPAAYQAWVPHDLGTCLLLSSWHPRGWAACLAPISTGSRESEDKAEFLVIGVPQGPQALMDSPRTFLFVPLHQGTGTTLDPAPCLPIVLTPRHTVFWLTMASRGHR